MDVHALLLKLSLMQQLGLSAYDFLLLNFKASILVLLALFLSHQLRDASAAYRQLVAAFTLSILVLLPLMSLVLPAMQLELLPDPGEVGLLISASPDLANRPEASVITSSDELSRWSFYLLAGYI